MLETLQSVQDEVHQSILAHMPEKNVFSKPLIESISYAQGGKHLRGVLIYAIASAWGKVDFSDSASAAVAMEMCHAQSLVHDDLPAMDDADSRRGKPSVHVAFGEAMAILAGDALLVMPYTVITRCSRLTDRQKTLLADELSVAVGPDGMIGGQAWDIDEDRKPTSEEELALLQSGKTGALFRACIQMGLIVAERYEEPEVQQWGDKFGRVLGSIFQIVDDILDETQSEEVLGKPAGQDQEMGKVTYPSLLGLEESRKLAHSRCEEAFGLLQKQNLDSPLLKEIVSAFRDRVN